MIRDGAQVIPKRTGIDSFEKLPGLLGNEKVLGLIDGRLWLVELNADYVEHFGPSAAHHAMVELQRPVRARGDGPDPSLVLDVPSGDAAAAPLSRGGENQKVDGPHVDTVIALPAARRQALQVYSDYITPVFSEILDNKPSMAVFRCWFAAEEDCRLREQVGRELFLDTPRAHKREEPLFVL